MFRGKWVRRWWQSGGIAVVSGINHNRLCNKPQSHIFVFRKIKKLFFTLWRYFWLQLNTKTFKKLNISIINNSITDLNNTTNAWYDNGDGIIDVNEIDYNNISNFGPGYIISFNKYFKLDKGGFSSYFRCNEGKFEQVRCLVL